MKPNQRPKRPHFSSGPCAKRPGWKLDLLANAEVGRSHRSKPGRAKLQEVIERSRRVLEIPDDYRLGIVPASDTGAVEMVLWSMLGARGVDVLAWESFGSQWVNDIIGQLELHNAKAWVADYGELPDLEEINFQNDVVFPWNGTTSGVRIPDGDWIPENRAGLTICDATSAVFAMELPWKKLDVVTWSWQKVLGGEAGHGMLCISPRAVERLETFEPPRPLPKIFRLTKGGKLIEGIFRGDTINTPSMLCVEDAIDALRWVESIGGRDEVRKRSEANLDVISEWVDRSSWVNFLASQPETRSCTSICLQIADPWFRSLEPDDQAAIAKRVAGKLDEEGIAFDIGSYRDAPPGLRIWAGATVERSDIEALLPWLDWAYAEIKGSGKSESAANRR
ncbi:MAG: phosphoserine transaminase [Deltaproteobacteria bacterium]|jgi:phosphoserine aminotransferase|nr:phosphoserine transaminase [Deltaproteobacteria bacterium]MBW2541404.1 phosphoserine transaminase [Deltaproteobacteria bacterium]